jgi:hypothetical protein
LRPSVRGIRSIGRFCLSVRVAIEADNLNEGDDVHVKRILKHYENDISLGSAGTRLLTLRIMRTEQE